MQDQCRHRHDVSVLAISVTSLNRIKADSNQKQLSLEMGPQTGSYLHLELGGHIRPPRCFCLCLPDPEPLWFMQVLAEEGTVDLGSLSR